MLRNAHKRFLIALAAVLSALAILYGCGGGGGGSSLTGLNVFITDDLRAGFDQVWVTVHEVELADSGGGHTTVFSSTDGVVVNLTNLNDGAKRFLFLGSAPIDAGEFTGARITLGRDTTLVPTGTTVGEALLFDPQFDFGADKSRFSFSFGDPQLVAATDDLVIDFDLTQWDKVGGFVTPFAFRGDGSSLTDESRQEEDDHNGTVSGLAGTAPNQTFTITRHGQIFHVFTDTDTVVFNEDGSASPMLANGQRIEVTGIFDRLEMRIEAGQIKIEDDDEMDLDDFEVEGVTENFNEAALTFDVLIREAEGFLPTEAIVHVQISMSTRFFTKSRMMMTLGEMVDLLNGGSLEVEVEGTFDEASNTITATKMKLDPEDVDHVHARGTARNIHDGLGSFSITLEEWRGFSSTVGTTIDVTTGGMTSFEGPHGADLTAEDFFAAVAAGSFVRVRGAFFEGTVDATRVRLKDPDHHEAARGDVIAFDPGSGTVVISLIEWSGFDSAFGEPLTIQTDGTTRFKTGDALSVELTREQFFAELAVGMVIDAEGNFFEDVLTARHIDIEG